MTVLGEELFRAPAGSGDSRWYGVHVGTVSDNQDPDGQGRVKVKLPWSPDPEGAEYALWARLATMMAGSGRGSWFVPDVDDEVLVAFAGGNPAHPFVVGALWNGADAPPQTMAAGNDIKVLRSRNGVQVTLDDTEGREQLLLETPGGTKVSLKDGPSTLRCEDANGNSVVLDPGGITVTASSKVSITASTVDVSASSVSVNAGMSRFSGVVQADTVITNSVVSASYTPGAGNIW